MLGTVPNEPTSAGLVPAFLFMAQDRANKGEGFGWAPHISDEMLK
jgi:hypothetical protein